MSSRDDERDYLHGQYRQKWILKYEFTTSKLFIIYYLIWGLQQFRGASTIGMINFISKDPENQMEFIQASKTGKHDFNSWESTPGPEDGFGSFLEEA